MLEMKDDEGQVDVQLKRPCHLSVYGNFATFLSINRSFVRAGESTRKAERKRNTGKELFRSPVAVQVDDTSNLK